MSPEISPNVTSWPSDRCAARIAFHGVPLGLAQNKFKPISDPGCRLTERRHTVTGGLNFRDLADEVGIKAASIYHHSWRSP
jgi:hypothetical protein